MEQLTAPSRPTSSQGPSTPPLTTPQKPEPCPAASPDLPEATPQPQGSGAPSSTGEPAFIEADLENPEMWEIPIWFVIHSRPRAEKKVAEWLVRHEMPHYLPLIERVRSYVSKKVVFLHPAFPGYLFGKFPLRQRSFVRQSGHVANIIFCKDQARLLEEMERIRQVLSSGLPVEKHPYLETGSRVVVTEGKLRGVEGIVIERLGSTRLVISVEMFQQAVCVEVDPRMLKPA